MDIFVYKSLYLGDRGKQRSRFFCLTLLDLYISGDDGNLGSKQNVTKTLVPKDNFLAAQNELFHKKGINSIEKK